MTVIAASPLPRVAALNGAAAKEQPNPASTRPLSALPRAAGPDHPRT